jgi:Fe-S oxidoreductase
LEASGLDIGLVEEGFERIVGLGPDAVADAVAQLVWERPEVYQALRRCCFCGYCTATCATHMAAAERMREWRGHFASAGLVSADESALIQVDNEWHIFSAYRAVYGIGYPEFTQLADAAAGEAAATPDDAAATVDTLFFPGCSLASYVPDLLRGIGQWLTAAGYRWALSLDCCGSPLMSVGLFERSLALRHRLLEQVRAAGIKRVLTICPGCGEELAEVMGHEVDIVPLPELLTEHLAHGGSALAEGLGQERAGMPSVGVGQPASSDAPFSVTFFDSCHDRFDTRHGRAVRALLRDCLPETVQVEMEHHGKHTLCCGAGGVVASYDPALTQRRTRRIIDEARATGAGMLVTTCPTCTYTIAQMLLDTEPGQGIPSRNYLELVFGQTIDWAEVFGRLEAMWTGEYARWLSHIFA